MIAISLWNKSSSHLFLLSFLTSVSHPHLPHISVKVRQDLAQRPHASDPFIIFSSSSSSSGSSTQRQSSQ